jgi:N-acylneuraminate cytidylyltransferase
LRLAVIPARGGSKRIPRKNVLPFAGRPMIEHSIACARESGLFDRIIVSTDDDEIARVARKAGADVPFRRPAELADDHATTTAVMAHAVDWARGAGLDPRAVCCIYATAPFITVTDLRRGAELLDAGAWKFAFSATTFGFPVSRALHELPCGGVAMYFPEHASTRSQDLPEAMHDAGQFYWGRPDAWLDGTRIFDTGSCMVRIPRWRVQDIDTPEDWRRAEILWRVLGEEADGR